MNKSFKVVFSKARSALMVVNEVTSSVQAKGTKTVVATAVAAMIAGVASAAGADKIETTQTVSNPDDVTLIQKVTEFNGVTSDSKAPYKSGAVLIKNGQTVTFKEGVQFVNNESSSAGGAIELQGGTVNLTNAVITGNKAASLGGAIRAFGNSTINLTVTKDTTYSGNTAEGKNNGLVTQPVAGGFAHLTGGNVTLNLKANKGAALTIADSITSAGAGNTINVKGVVNLNGSMEGYTGNINVEQGSNLTMATGFGSVDLWTQDQTNQPSTQYKGYGSIAEGKLTVEGNATATVGATTITRSTAQGGKLDVTSKPGTNFVVKDKGTLVVDSIAVTTKTYTRVAKDVETPTTNTTVGWGSLKNEEGGDATITKGLVLENGTKDVGTKFDIDGDVTVGYIDIAGAITDAKGGILTIKDGDVTVLGASKNAGEIDGTISGALITKADFANSGKVKLAGLKVQGGTFANTGDLTVTTVGVKGGTLTNAAEKKAKIDTLAIDGGKVTNDGEMVANTISIVNGSLTNTGKLFENVDTSTDPHSITIGDKGVLTTGAFIHGGENFIVFKQLDLKKGGTLNITALNDNADGKKDKAFDLLGFVQGVVNLNGGDLQVAGKTYTGAVKVAGTDVAVNVNGGSYTVSDLTVDDLATVTVGKNGTLSVTGKVENAANSLTNAGKLTVTASGINLKLKDGDVVAVTDTKFHTISNTGTVVVTGLDGQSVDINKVANVKMVVVGENSTGFVDLGKLTVDFGSGTATETGYDSTKNTLTNATAADLAGMTLDQFKNTTVTGVDDSTGVAGGNFGALQAADADKGVLVAGNTILNNDGLVAHDKDRKAVKTKIAAGTTLTTTGANAQIGEVTDGTGTLEVGAGKLSAAVSSAADEETTYHSINVDKINVAQGAAFESKGDVTVATGGDITGTANIKNLTVGGTLNVGNDDAAASLVVEKLAGSGKIFADPAWVDGVYNPSRVVIAEMTGGQVEAGRNSLVVVGTTAAAAEAAIAQTGFRIEEVKVNDEGEQTNIGAVNSVAYVAGVVDEGATFASPIEGKIAATKNTRADYEASSSTLERVNTDIHVSANSLLYVDMNGFDRDGNHAVFNVTTANISGDVFFGNVANGDTFNLGTAVTGTDASGFANVSFEDQIVSGNTKAANAYFTGDMLMKGKVAAGKLSVTMRTVEELEEESEGITDVVGFDAAYAYFKERANLNNTSKSAQFANWLWSEATTEAAGINTVAQLGQIADDVASIAGTAGMVNVTMDALSQFNDTVSARTSILARNGEGVNVWADVNGGKFEGKKVIAGAGYSSDIYAGVLGVDTTVACGAKIGAALTIGTADTDSKNTSAVTSMDSDLVGFSVYTSKTFGDIWNVAADIGYIQASNEVTTKAYNLGKFDADSNAFTFGIRGEVLTKAGALDIVPHAGLRYTRVDVDGFEAGFVTDYDAMNVFQMPVGVTVSGELEVAGWNVAPAFDLTFVPTWGDKNADLTLGINGASVKEAGTLRVLDSNVVNATLGVAAQNGAWTFGLDYKLGVGSDDRMNNTFNVNVRYAF